MRLSFFLSMHVAVCLLSGCGDPQLRVECQRGEPLPLSTYLSQGGVRLVPNWSGAALTAEGCPGLADQGEVTVNGQPGHVISPGGKVYDDGTSQWNLPRPPECHCLPAQIAAVAAATGSLEITFVDGDARVLAHYDDVVSKLRRVAAPAPSDAHPRAVAFHLETTQPLSRLELEQLPIKVVQWNLNSGVALECPLEIREGGLLVVTPCSQVGDPGHSWRSELTLRIPRFKRSRPATVCVGVTCEPMVVEVEALEETFEPSRP